MTEIQKKNILLCVGGLTPQIITETLFALKVKGECVDEIRVITTLEGRNRILSSLLDKNNGKFFEFCEDFGIDSKNIKFDETTIALLDTPDGKTLDDIRTPEENVLAGDKICKIVGELCKDENVRIHASAAGGRKTMSIYLTAAMQLFGRSDDTLSHVLVNEDFEGHREFFYPPPQPKTLNVIHPITKERLREISTENAKIYLAEVPFIRLRGIGIKAFDEGTMTYKQAVDKAQRTLRIAESAGELRFDLKRLVIKIADRQFKLTLRELFVYALFAHFRKEGVGEDGFVAFKDITHEHLDTICRKFFKANGRNLGFEDFTIFPKADFINRLDLQEAGKILYRKKAEKFYKKFQRKPEKGEIRVNVTEAQKLIIKNLQEILGKMKPKLEAVFTPEELFEEFYIERRGEKEAHIYGLPIEPGRIKFEHEK